MRKPLPPPSEVRVFSGVKGPRRGLIRMFYAAGCSIIEITEYLGLRCDEASTAIRYKAGDDPLCARKKAKPRPLEMVLIRDPCPLLLAVATMPVAYAGPMRCSI